MGPEVRTSPWVQSAGGDWRYNFTKTGAVVLNPQDQINTWANGFQNVMPDALEYYCRMGEVVGRRAGPIFGRWAVGGRIWSKLPCSSMAATRNIRFGLTSFLQSPNRMASAPPCSFLRSLTRTPNALTLTRRSSTKTRKKRTRVLI